MNPEILWPNEALKDLQPSNNRKLSVWHIEDDQSNLERVIAALAANREKLDILDYILIDYEILYSHNLSYEYSTGASPDLEANMRWHRDILEFSDIKRRILAEAIRDSGSRPKRLHEKQVTSLICRHIVEGHIEKARMGLKERYLARVESLIMNGQF